MISLFKDLPLDTCNGTLSHFQFSYKPFSDVMSFLWISSLNYLAIVYHIPTVTHCIHPCYGTIIWLAILASSRY
jgi:hypothetical protein